MSISYTRKLVLADGSEYYGYGFGSKKDSVTEIVFNTSMVGYQEIVSDPSYTYQSVVMTYPLIGNYGMADDDYETITPTIGGLIVHEYNPRPSNFRSTKTLEEVMIEYDIPGIYGIDTRKLTRCIRDNGSQNGLITSPETTVEEALKIIAANPIPKDAVSRVSCKEIWKSNAVSSNTITSSSVTPFHVVLIDCGAKHNIIQSLNNRNCNVTIVPWNTPAKKIEYLNPDGIMLSNGPGDPTDVQPVIDTVRQLKGKLPIFGICLGNQIISLAYGAKTYKLKFGHRGGNHPVKNLATGKVEITSQNHSYAVDEKTLEGTGLAVSHRNILDNTVEGVADLKNKIFSVQYHPESMPGPQDSAYLFDQFVAMMKK